jgi:adenylate cyclase
MQADALGTIGEWLIGEGLVGAEEEALVAGLAERLVAAGLPVVRVSTASDLLHPTLGARGFVWARGEGVARENFARRDGRSEHLDVWLTSPFYHLVQSNSGELRRPLGAGHRRGEFPLLDRLADRGFADYVAFRISFGEGGSLGEARGIAISFVAGGPAPFSDAEIDLLRRLSQPFALAYKASLTLGTSRSLMAIYLGADAAARVLRGSIARGQAETIRAVIWYSDLEGFTSLADTLPQDRLMAFLNDYAGTLTDLIHAQGGEVLKFMGDGILAIFDMDRLEGACEHALEAAVQAQRAAEAALARRRLRGEPASRVFIGLHVGDVLYGNIGGAERLDFTVLGPAVNEASRIERMGRSLEQGVVVSEAFAATCGAARSCLVSLGRYALRGVRRPQELFTLDPKP